MHGVIMAGGFGTRLRPLTINIPKPMTPVMNRPMMAHIVGLLAREGIRDLVALLYFQPETIREYFGDGRDFGVRLSYVGAAEDYGTAGSVKNAERWLAGGGTFLVISGDILTDFDLGRALAYHRERRALATMVLTRVDNPLPFGIVVTGDDGRVQRFLEKPSWGEVFSDTINTGIYILEPEVLARIPPQQAFDFSNDLFPRLLAEGAPLYGYVADGYWKDLGTLGEYRLAHRDILEGRVRLPVPGERLAPARVWLEEGARIDYTASLDGAIVGRGCVVAPRAVIRNSVLGHGCVVEEGAVVTDSVVWDRVRIGKRARLQEAIVANDCTIGDGAFLDVGAIVADHCRVGKGATLRADVKLWPRKEVEDGATLAVSLIWGEKWSRAIFGTQGVTGLANLELSPEFAARLGAAYGASLGKGATVSTSRDAHKSCRMINRAIMTGLLSTGVNVNDFGVTPLPVVRYQAGNLGDQGGVHTRRNPVNPDFIDLRFFDSRGMDLDPKKEQTIERLFYREDFRRATMEETGEINFPVHGTEFYQTGFLQAVAADAIRRAGLRLVIDYAYGSATTIFPAILGRLSLDVISLNAFLDASRATRPPEEERRGLEQLAQIVVSLKADLGVMLDPSAERLRLVDERGEIVPAEQVPALMALLAARQAQADGAGRGERGGTERFVAVPITASRVVEEVAARYGCGVLRTKTTPRSMMETALRPDVLVVAEESGGVIFPSFQPAFDAMFATAKLIELLARSGERLGEALRQIPPAYLAREVVPCPWEAKGRVMRRLMEEARGSDVQLVDGIKIFEGSDWVLAFPSQDHAAFHVIAEAGSRERARALALRVAGRIQEWLGGAGVAA
ncbi:MAG TPA: mannose-1-phosphate guanyltransferase [Thermodesulfobacteriota bacterium]|nr:mannose-1-phosphate guanyltransferase [Thermodesulfobacteriota bacterium]